MFLLLINNISCNHNEVQNTACHYEKMPDKMCQFHSVIQKIKNDAHAVGDAA